ncbi:interferon alpha-inducible protein 27-like protein 2A [Scomber scombrus]|uniref:Interferon alpha-inducible protein 27-like protein 2A n=1 Tax=Scomber scombrus TaxID=13677 RepID=A0AAV1PVE7_SCOSC
MGFPLCCRPCAVGAVVATPLALGAAGFTSAGIAAGSVAAKMMSAAAVTSGGGVAAGSTVAVLQCGWSVRSCHCSCGRCWSSSWSSSGMGV